MLFLLRHCTGQIHQQPYFKNCIDVYCVCVQCQGWRDVFEAVFPEAGDWHKRAINFRADTAEDIRERKVGGDRRLLLL